MLLKLILVNLLTLTRVIGTVVLIPLYYTKGAYFVSKLALLIYATDIIDGVLARKFHVSTFFGALFDGVADKLFTIINFVVLYMITPYALIIIVIELLIVLTQLYKFNHHLNIQSNIFGKAKTWIIAACVILTFFISGCENAPFVTNSFVSFVNGISNKLLYFILLSPAIIMEVLTLFSYMFEVTKPENLKALNIKNDNKKRIRLKGKNKVTYFKEVWFSPKFYQEHKNDVNLKDLRKLSKENIG